MAMNLSDRSTDSSLEKAHTVWRPHEPPDVGVYTYFPLAQQVLAACWAIDLRCSAVSALALAFPPFSPPCRPNATAAGFFPSYEPILKIVSFNA
jgi:hypothetical protein